jgi:hypothetical protein
LVGGSRSLGACPRKVYLILSLLLTLLPPSQHVVSGSAPLRPSTMVPCLTIGPETRKPAGHELKQNYLFSFQLFISDICHNNDSLTCIPSLDMSLAMGLCSSGQHLHHHTRHHVHISLISFLYSLRTQNTAPRLPRYAS